jgi:hypothetical protein
MDYYLLETVSYSFNMTQSNFLNISIFLSELLQPLELKKILYFLLKDMSYEV